MNGLKFFLLSLILILFILNCSSSSHKNIVDNFYATMQSGDFEKAYSILSEKDKKYISKKIFLGETELQQTLNKKYWSYVKYRVLSYKDNSDASVIVELTAPDLGEILGKRIAHMIAGFSSNGGYVIDETNRNAMLLDMLNSKKFNYITFQKTLYVLMENNKQKVFINIGEGKKVFQLIREAIEHNKDKNYSLAISKLNEALKIDPENTIATRYLKLLTDKVKE